MLRDRRRPSLPRRSGSPPEGVAPGAPPEADSAAAGTTRRPSLCLNGAICSWSQMRPLDDDRSVPPIRYRTLALSISVQPKWPVGWDSHSRCLSAAADEGQALADWELGRHMRPHEQPPVFKLDGPVLVRQLRVGWALAGNIRNEAAPPTPRQRASVDDPRLVWCKPLLDGALIVPHTPKAWVVPAPPSLLPLYPRRNARSVLPAGLRVRRIRSFLTRCGRPHPSPCPRLECGTPRQSSTRPSPSPPRDRCLYTGARCLGWPEHVYRLGLPGVGMTPCCVE